MLIGLSHGKTVVTDLNHCLAVLDDGVEALFRADGLEPPAPIRLRVYGRGSRF